MSFTKKAMSTSGSETAIVMPTWWVVRYILASYSEHKREINHLPNHENAHGRV